MVIYIVYIYAYLLGLLKQKKKKTFVSLGDTLLAGFLISAD